MSQEQLNKYTHVFEESIKANGLSGKQAKLYLVLPGGGLFLRLYETGVMQAIVDHLAVMTSSFSSGADVEVWGYAKKCKKLEMLGVANAKDYIQRHRHKAKGFFAFLDTAVISDDLGSEHNPVPAIEAISKEYINSAETRTGLVVFIEDGHLGDDVQGLIKVGDESSKTNLFFQFIALSSLSPSATSAALPSTSLGKQSDYTWFDDVFGPEEKRGTHLIDDSLFYSRILKPFSVWLDNK